MYILSSNYLAGAMHQMDNITDVVDHGLCNGCGTCVGMCPRTALHMQLAPETGMLVPSIDTAECDGCGLCLKVCPGKGVPFGELLAGGASFESSSLPFGTSTGCWRGSSSDPSVRSSSSSGGLTTSILAHALERGYADGAMVIRVSKDDPFSAEPFIAGSPKDILEAAGSKYLPAPLNTLLAQVRESEGRFIAVGLPCHIHGIRLAQRVQPRLRDMIPVCLSLACHHTPSCLAMDFILGRLKLEKADVKRLEYRAGSWPGCLRFTLGDGTSIEIPYSSELYWGGLLQHFFVPNRCMMCIDKMSILSDITFMDAWRMPRAAEHQNTGLAVARTPLGEELFQSAVSSGVIAANQVTEESVHRSQDVMSNLMARCAHIESARRRGSPIPSYGLARNTFELSGLAHARFAALLNSASYSRYAWPLISMYTGISGIRRRLHSVGQNSR